ncbi:bi-functional transferase/deacetylase [Mangrovactinospora gilvigrisea]|uniref:Bi-functional transferase/deacetylase n=1 Tax=Mangrovactinospora gilvigrisea TaxID=1428644 RepID=A0A1J7B9L8_9ACTN|nr:bifunctional polysaccharide deacetylase/glycosyltransferase family 2 protein [Mangrovactinospora gilvigrisea]OIV35347.1 bi-functional transferase/deacetylase [Mangrovactinospora gilvigrisea]
MAARHKHTRVPRGHWLLLAAVLAVTAAALLLQGFTANEVDGATSRLPCASPAPAAVRAGGPVLVGHGSRSVPAGTAAITVNGGPDPVWTPRILDLLPRHHARATFFLLGSEAARHPGLVRRIRAGGNEIGSYTYSGAAMDRASPLRSRLELSLGAAALAGSGGLRTTLLRMPLTGSPDTLCGRQWTATRRALDAGSAVVATDMWNKRDSAGVVRQYTQDATGYARIAGLLANPRIHRFPTVTDAVGLPRAEHPVPTAKKAEGLALIAASRLGHLLVTVLTWTVGAAGVLGMARLALLALFARVHVRRLERYRPGSPWLRQVDDPVTVIVPAYNEEEGIRATLRSLLASTHADLQILVVDDGSTDRTAARAAKIAALDGRVQVVRQFNAGKAAALNTGLAHARCAVVVMVDADTVLDADAIRRLIQPLSHPAVGAVSGNTKVGNRRRLLGRWQHLEYCFGFNLDRRMFEVLECMLTVPGAIGAFRRDAVLGIGGVSDDTLAEDTDLTMGLWRAGWRVVYEETAVAWTEVPTGLRQLWRQRYRWCYGTLRAAWKHRACVREFGPAGRFGRRGLGYLLLFQIALPLFAPVIDVFTLYSALFQDPSKAALLWCGFLLSQLLCAGYALRLDGERLRTLWALPFQALVYRQLMYLVVIQSVVSALSGTRLRWHRARRAGTAAQQLARGRRQGRARVEARGTVR